MAAVSRSAYEEDECQGESRTARGERGAGSCSRRPDGFVELNLLADLDDVDCGGVAGGLDACEWQLTADVMTTATA